MNVLVLIFAMFFSVQVFANHPLETRQVGDFLIKQDSQLSSAIQTGLQNRKFEKARLTVAFDYSGSSYIYTDFYKSLEWDAHAMLGARYPQVDISNVSFDHKHRLEVDQRFDYRRTTAGGTSYRAGIYGARMSTYFDDYADHYILLVGDFEDGFDKKVYHDLMYLEKVANAVIMVNIADYKTTFSNQMRRFAMSSDRVIYFEQKPNDCSKALVAGANAN